jgi:hypothetical protein
MARKNDENRTFSADIAVSSPLAFKRANAQSSTAKRFVIPFQSYPKVFLLMFRLPKAR